MLATIDMYEKIIRFYEDVIACVNQTDIKLGWNILTYPDSEFIQTAIEQNQMHVMYQNEEVVAAAVVNHIVNKEYQDINWAVTGPSEHIATIHALAVSPKHRGNVLSVTFLNELEDYCRANGDEAIHLDVIDTNIPAYKLYTRLGYQEMARIKMYYEVVGTREFWMLEKIL